MSYFSQFTNRQATPNRVITFGASGNWVAPTAGWVTIAVVGAGGSGGAVGVNFGDKATGGGAGGFAVKTFYTPSGATYVITIGAGGASKDGNSTGANGSSGGITTVNGTLCSLTCNSGGGGFVGYNGAGTSADAFDGGAAGNATGGDFNYTGGKGGSIVIGTGTNDPIATGGGAVSINGTAYNGGSINVANYNFTASGGGGVGGSAGNPAAGNRVSSGGGTGGPGYTLENILPSANNSVYVPGGVGSPTTASVVPFLFFQAQGGAGFNAPNPSANVYSIDAAVVQQYIHGGFGAGGGGLRMPGSAGTTAGRSMGFGGGGGAIYFNNTNSPAALGGASMIGGGGGGAARGSSGEAYSGAGGSGAVYIGFYGNNT